MRKYHKNFHWCTGKKWKFEKLKSSEKKFKFTRAWRFSSGWLRNENINKAVAVVGPAEGGVVLCYLWSPPLCVCDTVNVGSFKASPALPPSLTSDTICSPTMKFPILKMSPRSLSLENFRFLNVTEYWCSSWRDKRQSRAVLTVGGEARVYHAKRCSPSPSIDLICFYCLCCNHSVNTHTSEERKSGDLLLARWNIVEVGSGGKMWISFLFFLLLLAHWFRQWLGSEWQKRLFLPLCIDGKRHRKQKK